MLLSFLNDSEFSFDTLLTIINKNLRVENLNTLDDTQIRSVLNWMIHFFWHAKNIYNNKRWLDLYGLLKDGLYFLIENEKTDNVMYLQFAIYHFMGNNYQTQEERRVGKEGG